MRKINFTILLLFLVVIGFTRCSSGLDNQNETRQHSDSISNEQMKVKKKLTIFLVDVSGSFNEIVKGGGHFNGKNYFDIACNQIYDYIRNAKGGEYIIVKQIKSNSFDETGFVCNLDLSDSTLVFTKPKPTNVYEVNDWENEKNTFEKNADKVLTEKRNIALHEINTFKNNYTNKPSGSTDVFNAIFSCKQDFDKAIYSDYIKTLIIYSDFWDTQNQIEGEVIEIPDVTVEGRFVSKANHNRTSYEKMINMWKDAINDKSIVFKTPEQSE